MTTTSLATTLFLVPWVCDGVPEGVRRRAFAVAYA